MAKAESLYQRWSAGQLAARGSHSITQRTEVSAIPTFVTLNNPASAPAPRFSPSHIFVPSLLLVEGLKSTLDNMAHTSAAGFESLNNYSMSGRALNWICCLIVSCHLEGTHVQYFSEVICAEIKRLLLLMHDNVGVP